MAFLEILTFPVKIALVIAAYILRAVLALTGTIICHISEIAGGLLKIVGILTDIIAVMMTVFAIKQINTREIETKTAIIQIVGFWILTILFNSVGFAGYTLGQILIEFGENITDKTKDLLFS